LIPKLGQWLRRTEGQIYDGHKIILGSPDRHDKVQRWALVPQGAGNRGFAGIVSANAGEFAGEKANAKLYRTAETLPAAPGLPADDKAEKESLSDAEKERLRALWDSRWDS
jgi:hypothetical protein